MSKPEQKLTPLSEIGEFGLIDHITKGLEIKNKETIKGIGDDAAILHFDSDEQIVVTTDFLIEDVHFDLSYTPLKHLGYKSVVVNLSDICAMNALPKQITISIAVSNRYTVEAINELYEGVKLACDFYDVDLIGGDTTSSTRGLTICVTAIGNTKKDNLSLRNGAQKNDLICVSGDLGGAYMGLQLLEREKKIFHDNPQAKPDFSDYEYILGRQLKPEARKDVVELLRKAEIKPTAMIDISDGLSSEALHICKQSNVGCKIFEEKIPIHPQTTKMGKELSIDATIGVLNGGEDYELLFTVPLKDYEKIKDVNGISLIGHICSENEGAHLIARDGTPVPLQAQGWNSYQK